jgi:hypothetical protein
MNLEGPLGYFLSIHKNSGNTSTILKVIYEGIPTGITEAGTFV